ncbi:cytochrome c oxidase subunit 3 [Azospirillum thermophilum]|uniref:Copper oxidase n=1 Tax=Azospirillum thermophilum TaxID=2202148 RepID=A0A2S2CLA5_9PROT|nr:cytochrome c oxidase subunit 3 [Azospirillum thermophilum]AWK85298.1 copper oxidase [Azospirillum thermophilum]
MTVIDSTDSDEMLEEQAGADPLAGLPGHPMMWILILSELAVFGIAFVGFAVARLLDPAGFAAGQAHLSPLTGGLNTIVLVTSGFLAAAGVAAARDGRRGRARGLFVVAAVLGLLFLGVKGTEYAASIAAGHTLDSGGFFTLYYLLTGFHALHVALGMVILLIVAWKDSVENLETGASFWHMLDLVWVLLYPLLYLLR